MTRKLNINVQVDQLPDVTIPGETMLYFGVRLSAFVLPDLPPAAPDRATAASPAGRKD